MNAIRRILILSVLTVAVIAGASLPAWATYADSQALPTTTIVTVTVAPPTQVEAKATCTTTVDPATGATTTTVQAKVEWHRSTTPGVSDTASPFTWRTGRRPSSRRPAPPATRSSPTSTRHTCPSSRATRSPP